MKHFYMAGIVIVFFFSVGKPVVPPPTSAPVVSKPATIVAPGATSRLIHPDEDISLVKIHLFPWKSNQMLLLAY